MADVSVRVALRIRPLVPSEIEKGCQVCVHATEGESQIQVQDTHKTFTFNHVFPPDVTQETFYKNAVQGLIGNLFKGYNVTILAYGQTGSGKTHSMGTSYAEGDDMGVIPRSIKEIFQFIEDKEDWQFKITVAFMELYQEQLYDLLSSKSRENSVVDIREDMKGIKIPGLTEIEVTNVGDTIRCLTQGSAGRATGATAMNAQSSRSHAIFTITIHQQQRDDINTATTAKFHLVDLAGSERSKKTKATGERFKEGVNINKGLLALGNVISLLGDGNSHNYIGYRDSKLTRLLQDSLGGNSMTLMIACISPADYNLDETMSTLRYADRALRIKNKPIVNQDPHAAEISRLNKLVQELRLQLIGRNCDGTGQACPPEHSELQEKVQSMQAKNRDLTARLNSYLVEFMHMHERADLAEKASQIIATRVSEMSKDLQQMIDSFPTDVEELNEHRDKLIAIHKKLQEFQNDNDRAAKEILDHELSSNHEFPIISHASNTDGETPSGDFAHNTSDGMEPDITEPELDVKEEEHTLQQAERKDAVQNINRELALKESLVAKLLANSSHYAEFSKAIPEMEQEIKKLQAEKEDLLKALENVHTNKASAKIAETRRKKVQELEKKISELTRKLTEQNSVIKGKEKSDVKIKNLTTEIQAMKQHRVKLIRTMRTENEKFRQWKIVREQELRKLRDQDRKRQNQMIRMESHHGKLQNVLKRKVEEACAINKRLKEALDKQSKAQQKRDKAGNSVSIQSWVTQEMDVLVSTIDAERSLERLMQDRALFNQKLTSIKANRQLYDVETYEKEVAALTEDLQLRSAQIAGLQQKIMDSDQENKGKTRWNTLQSMSDAKTALKTLFDQAADMRREQFEKNYQYDELMEKTDNLQMKLRQLELQQKVQMTKQREREARIEAEHEETVAHLLEQLRKATSQANGGKENVAPREKDPETPPVTQNATFNTPKNEILKKKAHLYVDDDVLTDDSVVMEDDLEKDPDWTKTPLYKRFTRLLNSTSTAGADETRNGTKRSSDGEIRCGCKTTNCLSRLCSCRKNNVPCSGCSCSDTCGNRDLQNITQSRLFPDTVGTEVMSKRPR